MKGHLVFQKGLVFKSLIIFEWTWAFLLIFSSFSYISKFFKLASIQNPDTWLGILYLWKNIIDSQKYFVEHDPHCTVVCLEISFSKNVYHIETSQLICFVNQLTGFYMMQGFTERYFQTGYSVVKFQGKMF